jgi:hypothetical protein
MNLTIIVVLLKSDLYPGAQKLTGELIKDALDEFSTLS